MRILYDSKLPQFKTPFGTLRTGETCSMNLYVPDSGEAVGAFVVLENCDEAPICEVPMTLSHREGEYNVWHGEFSLDCGLYFYWFRLRKENGSFRLFREGNGTNMEKGEKWQVSFLPSDMTVPQYAKGAVIYQILPDRFHQVGRCDLSDKLKPFRLHENLDDTPDFTADREGNWCNDFYGGNLAGIREKLPYLKSLGVDIVYLNPIFMAYSNHRYDTADYRRIDPMLGTEEDFRALCERAHELGLRVILDGVFNHTGSNSVYFDAKGVFGHGAVSDPDSPYRRWYRFSHYPDAYDAWWSIPTMPNLEETEESYVNYIIEDEDSVVAHWMRLGADGYRLDVVDETPDCFVKKLKDRVRSINPNALVIGEVWEDASNKRAYGVSRRYFVDAELDSVMNYPWRRAIVDFVLGRDDGRGFGETVMTLAENYPPEVLLCVMNLLGTHDTPRILTVLGDDFEGTKEEKATRFLSEEAKKIALARLRMATFLQFTLPGMAAVYYGDEVGMEGFDDPFSRRYFPWGREDRALQSHFAALAEMKHSCDALRFGDVRILRAGEGVIAFARRTQTEVAEIYVNRTDRELVIASTGELLFARDADTDGDLCRVGSGGCCVLHRNLPQA